MLILVSEEVERYLQKHALLPAFKKAQYALEKGHYSQVQLRKREPKSTGIWYFRITQKYRAYAKKVNETLLVFEISDHQ